MKRSLVILLLVAGLLVFAAAPGSAGGRHGPGPGGHPGWHGGTPAGYGGHPGGYGGHGGWHGGAPGWYGGYRGWYGGPRWYGGPGWYGGPRWYGGVFIGPGWWGASYPYWYYPPNYVVVPPAVAPGPSVYIQQQSAPLAESPDAFWYYCPSSQSYYPTVQTCREAWIKVPPRAE